MNLIKIWYKIIDKLANTRHLSLAEVEAENEKIRQENERYRQENPLGLEWLIYNNGQPFMERFTRYIEWGTPAHWRLPDGASIENSIKGFWGSCRYLTAMEVLQLGQGVNFPRSYADAIEAKKQKTEKYLSNPSEGLEKMKDFLEND